MLLGPFLAGVCILILVEIFYRSREKLSISSRSFFRLTHTENGHLCPFLCPFYEVPPRTKHNICLRLSFFHRRMMTHYSFNFVTKISPNFSYITEI